MRVEWSEFIDIPSATSGGMITDVNQKPIVDNTMEFQYEGEVVFRYRSFWGVPKFVVALDDGTLKSVSMEKCRIKKEENNNEQQKEAERCE